MRGRALVLDRRTMFFVRDAGAAVHEEPPRRQQPVSCPLAFRTAENEKGLMEFSLV
jgi:hypothetical protein